MKETAPSRIYLEYTDETGRPYLEEEWAKEPHPSAVESVAYVRADELAKRVYALARKAEDGNLYLTGYNMAVLEIIDILNSL